MSHNCECNTGKAGKGKKQRMVCPTPDLRQVIQCAQSYKAGKGIQSESLFVNSDVNPWNPSSYGKLSRKCWRKAGFIFEEDRTHTRHEVRHGLATLLRAKGVEADLIAKLLGHTDPGTTERFYILSGQEEEARLAEGVGKIVTTEFLKGGNLSNLLGA